MRSSYGTRVIIVAGSGSSDGEECGGVGGRV